MSDTQIEKAWSFFTGSLSAAVSEAVQRLTPRLPENAALRIASVKTTSKLVTIET